MKEKELTVYGRWWCWWWCCCSTEALKFTLNAFAHTYEHIFIVYNATAYHLLQHLYFSVAANASVVDVLAVVVIVGILWALYSLIMCLIKRRLRNIYLGHKQIPKPFLRFFCTLSLSLSLPCPSSFACVFVRVFHDLPLCVHVRGCAKAKSIYSMHMKCKMHASKIKRFSSLLHFNLSPSS